MNPRSQTQYWRGFAANFLQFFRVDSICPDGYVSGQTKNAKTARVVKPSIDGGSRRFFDNFSVHYIILYYIKNLDKVSLRNGIHPIKYHLLKKENI